METNLPSVAGKPWFTVHLPGAQGLPADRGLGSSGTFSHRLLHVSSAVTCFLHEDPRKDGLEKSLFLEFPGGLVLRIQHCHCYDTGSVPGPETSACCLWGQKKKKVCSYWDKLVCRRWSFLNTFFCDYCIFFFFFLVCFYSVWGLSLLTSLPHLLPVSPLP